MAPNLREACANLHGDVGYQNARPCRPPPPQAVGIPRLVLQTVHDKAHDGFPCDPSVRDTLP